MKRLRFLLVFAALALLGGCSLERLQGDGNITTVSRPITEFTSLQAAGAYTIQWTSGAPSLQITGDQNLLPHIHTTMSGATLKISTDEQIAPTRSIKIVVACRMIDQADLSGAIHLTATRIAGTAISVTAAGASTIDLDGGVADFTASLTGASQLKAHGLNTRSATITLVGASSGDISVRESLSATITGAGALTYSGDPKTVEQQVTGAGSIHRR